MNPTATIGCAEKPRECPAAHSEESQDRASPFDRAWPLLFMAGEHGAANGHTDGKHGHLLMKGSDFY